MRSRGVASMLAIGAAIFAGGGAYAQTAGTTTGGAATVTVPSTGPEGGGGGGQAVSSPFGSFNIKGLLRSEISMSATNKAELDDTKNERTFNLLAGRAEADIYWRYSSQLTGYGKLRVFGDWANEVNDTRYQPQDQSEFRSYKQIRNQAWAMDAHGDHWEADVSQLYFDYRPGPFWIRVGKQQIAWGEAIGIRTVDNIQGLDLRRHSFFDVPFEEYSDKRLATTGVRAGIGLGKTGWELELYATNFQPTIFPNFCTAYRPLCYAAGPQVLGGRVGGYGAGPGVLGFNGPQTVFGPSVRLHQIDRFHAWKLNYGGRLHGNLGPIEAQFGFISHPDNDGLFENRGFDPGGSRDGLVTLTRKFPREDFITWGFNYLYMSEAGDSFWDGTVIRTDGTWSWNRKVNISQYTLGIKKLNSDFAAALTVEKTFKWNLRQPALFVSLYPIYFRGSTDPADRWLSVTGRKHYIVTNLGMQQPIGDSRVHFDFFISHDWYGANYISPGVFWKPSGAYQVDLYANFFQGRTSSAHNAVDQPTLYRLFDSFDEVFLRLTRYF